MSTSNQQSADQNSMDLNLAVSPTLFVADVPSTLLEGELVTLFKSYEGFRDARLRKDKNNNVVGFVDFEDGTSAQKAKDSLNGHKFTASDRGITIHFSHALSPRAKTRQDKTTFASMHRMNNQNNTNLSSSEELIEVEKEKEKDKEKDKDEGEKSTRNNSERRPASINLPIPDAAFSPAFYSPLFPTNVGYIQQPAYANLFPTLPGDASPTLFLEGLPSDATEREVAHIFRQWPGFQSIRILPKESKGNPSRTYNLCFVEFDNKYQATMAMHHLQGYRIDMKNESKGMSISYAKTERKRSSLEVKQFNKTSGGKD